ncbi:MAG TPA: hypothetical protein VH917_00955, partial [Ignavibacteriaceae bacterium]
MTFKNFISTSDPGLRICELILILCLISPIINHNSSIIHSQVVYTPLHSDVYDFLERQSLKHLVNIDDEVKPFS